MKNKQKTVSNDLQKKYTYTLREPVGRNFDPDFKPDLSPKEMLKLGVFGGHYHEYMKKEYPKSWFVGVELSQSGQKEKELNYFKTRASQPLSVWKKKGWIYKDDPHGWFEWYCRYYLGRRSEDDARQIKRWKAMRRHIGQIKAHCRAKDVHCRPRQRQALLHWAYDSRRM